MDAQALAKQLDQGLQDQETKLSARFAEYENQLEKSGAATDELKAELSKLGDAYSASLKELKSLNDDLIELQQKGVSMDQGAKAESIGAQFIASESFKAFVSGSTNKARVEFQNNTVIGEGGSPQNPTNDIVPLQTLDGIVGGAFRSLRVIDIIPKGVAAGNTVHYTRETTFVNNAAEVAEGGAKPETDITFEGVDDPVRTIAHFIKVSKQVLDDAPSLQSYIDVRMSYGVQLRVEQQIIGGDGVAPNIAGIGASGNHVALPVVTGDNDFDAANRAKQTVETFDYMADAYLINPADWGRLERKKVGTGDERYVGADGAIAYVNQGLTPVLWGLPVVKSNSVPAGTFYCLSNMAWMWMDRQAPTVEIFEQDGDNVQKNLLTVRGETRGALATFTPAAIIKGAWPDA